MLHCIIEYFDNILNQPNWNKFMSDIHSGLDKLGLLNINYMNSKGYKRKINYK